MKDFAPYPRPRQWRQPVIVLGAALLLHLLVFDWISSGDARAQLARQRESVMAVVWLASPVAPPPAAPLSVAKPAPKPLLRAVKPRAAAPPLPPPVPPPDIVTAESEIVNVDGSQPIQPPPPAEDIPRDSDAATTPAATASTTVAEPSIPVAAVTKSAEISPPPSAELNYDVTALKDGKTIYGSGKIGWRNQGDRYLIDGVAIMLFVSVLSFTSGGSLGDTGLAPLLYSEKRFRKSATNTHFQREQNVISFSASTASYPRSGEEQDRASIIWQLAAMGRGNPDQFNRTPVLDITVAGVRDAEPWHIQVVGSEQIRVGGADLSTLHLQRLPRPGSYDTQVDIWLAPSREWYPVRLRQTERNGDYLDMSMSTIKQLASN